MSSAARPVEPRVRSMLLGLAIGDALGNNRAGGASLLAGVSTQLACFTVEGLIRASLRQAGKGICHPPSVIWHAYCRWAALQGIDTERMRARWGPGTHSEWPDGWLAQVPALARRRGDAPATVRALRGTEQGSVQKPATNSSGCHALIRTLPMGVHCATFAPEPGARMARDVAALTHGNPGAYDLAAEGVLLISRALTSGDVFSALPESPASRDGRDRPADPARLAAHAPDGSAASALAGGSYVAASFPEAARLTEALHFAVAAPDGDAVAAVTGAILGAVHGVDALPIDLLARHELAWVIDVLARDLLTELNSSQVDNPQWTDRYPGW